MDVPADRSRPTGALPVHPEAVRSRRRRRPTGAAPPLPYRLQTSGIRWLVAAIVLVGLTLAILTSEQRHRSHNRYRPSAGGVPRVRGWRRGRERS